MKSPASLVGFRMDDAMRREMKDRTETMDKLDHILGKLPEKEANAVLAKFGIFTRDSFELLTTVRLKEICRALEEAK